MTKWKKTNAGGDEIDWGPERLNDSQWIYAIRYDDNTVDTFVCDAKGVSDDERWFNLVPDDSGETISTPPPAIKYPKWMLENNEIIKDSQQVWENIVGHSVIESHRELVDMWHSQAAWFEWYRKHK